MKVGIWAVGHPIGNHWAAAGMIKEGGPGQYFGSDSRFATTDLNVAFRYVEVLVAHYRYTTFEVKEKP